MNGRKIWWLVVVLCSISLIWLVYLFAHSYVLDQVEKRVRDTMLECHAFHHYVQEKMHPVYYDLKVNGRLPKEFYAPELLSSSYIVRSIQRHYNEERRKNGLAEIRYKMAAIDPRNPVNKATDFERQLIEWFNEDPSRESYRKVIEEDGKRYFLYAKPFLRNKKACLKCHGKAEEAPSDLRTIYNWKSGWNRPIGAISAVEFIWSPLEGEYDVAMLVIAGLVIFLGAGITLLAFNTRLQTMVALKTEDLRQSEENLSTTLHSIGDAVISTDRQGRVVRINLVAERLTGWKSEEAKGRNLNEVFKVVNARTREPVANPYQKVTETGKTVGLANHTVLIAKDGKEYQIADSAAPIKHRSGETTGVVLVFRDVTKEYKLQQKQRWLATMTEQVAEGIALANLEKKIEYANSAWAKMHGFESGQELVGMPISTFHTETQLKDEVEPFIEEVLEKNYKSGEVGHKRQDGSVFPTLMTTTLLRDDDGKPYAIVCSAQDITELKRAEEDRRRLLEKYSHSQKVESIGRLAGGIAHDLNNLLSPILGFSEMLQEDIPEEDDKRESVDQIMNASLRARDLVRQLLAYSRKQSLHFTTTNLNETLCKFEKLLRRTIRENIEIKFDLDEKPLPIAADVGKLEQVITNLAVNSQDAMPRGGTLTFSTGKGRLKNGDDALQESMKPGIYVRLSIADNGCGMDKTIVDHLFEPFFSTKGDHGTGLGLATVQGIVKQHGGSIVVQSDPGKGTTFTIHLPVAEAVRSRKNMIGEVSDDLRGSETILVVEDDEQVRNLARALLKRQGYKVHSVANGEEALEFIEKNEDEINLLLTDVIMPGLNGRELHEKICEHFGEIKVLYMSGYNYDVITKDGIIEEGLELLEKPFTANTLAKKVRKTLD